MGTKQGMEYVEYVGPNGQGLEFKLGFVPNLCFPVSHARYQLPWATV